MNDCRAVERSQEGRATVTLTTRSSASSVAGEVRAAALGLLARLVLAALHQRALGGDRCRPLDLRQFLATHLDAFLRAWAPEQPPSPPPSRGDA